MSDQLKSAIVRVLGEGNAVVGAGFLATETTVLTCSHVVEQALGISQIAEEIPTAIIKLDFPLVAPGKALSARVVRWTPVQTGVTGTSLGSNISEDVAVLELADKLPEGSSPVTLIETSELWGHSFRAFGFPAAYDTGVWASGLLRDAQSNGWVQIEDIKETGYAVAPGFSGTPIWDDAANGVVGMVVVAEKRSEIKVAFIIPTNSLLNVWPKLRSHTDSHREQTRIFKADTYNSVAVLPFVNLSSQAENEYFCDGLAEELLNALAKLEGLQVAARTSAFSFKGKDANVSVIGRALNVQTVLEGTMRKSGNRLRITVQLVNTENGYHLWSERYDREMQDIFDVQDEITLAIVAILKVKLLGEAKASPLMRHTENIEAYQLYLKGRYYWNKWTPDGFNKSMECFTQAIGIDPNYALAYSGLADGFSTLGFTLVPPREVFPKAKEEATKALGINNMLSEAHTSLGVVNLFYDWDWLTAEREAQRAIELNRSNQGAHLLYYWYLLVMGRHSDALAKIKKAQELDPLSHFINTSVGFSLYLAGEDDQAIEQYMKVIEMDPNFLPAHDSLARVYSKRHMHSEAFAAIQRTRDLPEYNAHMLTLLGYTYGMCGNREEAQNVLDGLIELSMKSEVRIDPAEIAIVCAGLGELDQAFEWLDIAYEYRSPNMVWLKVEPIWDSLRSDLRFAKLLHRMGLTP